MLEVSRREEWAAKSRLAEWRSAEIPARLHNLRLGDLTPKNDSQALAIDRCLHLVRCFRDHYVSSERSVYPEDPGTIGRGLMLVGPAGTGKTTLAGLTLIELFRTHPGLFFYPQYRGRRDERRVRFLAMADLMAMKIEYMRNDVTPERSQEIRESLDDAREAVLLVLDDVGAEHRSASGYAEGEVARLIRSRHRNACPTIVTTNVRPMEWREVYGESLASFLAEAFEIVSIVGEDIRGQALGQVGNRAGRRA
jgi:DNA replication protein DnaC